jgi:hypothetical protein
MKHTITNLTTHGLILAAMNANAALDIAHCAVSTKPLTNWTSAFLTGNGNMGVIMAGEPYNETLIINGKFFLPTGGKEVVPDLAALKDEFKKAGLAAGKDGPATIHKLIAEKCEEAVVHTDAFHPACVLRLAMKSALGSVKNYLMTEDFKTGELQVRWSDERGDWCRKLFVSRPDDVIVMSITGPKGKVDCELAMEVQHPLVKSEPTIENGWLATHNSYLKGKGGFDNLIRVIPTGGKMTQRDGRITVTGADAILLIMQVKQWKAPLPKEQCEAWAYSPDHPDFQGAYTTNRLAEMKRTLSRLRPDYAKLLAPHAKAHGALYNRVSLDLGGGEDRQLISEELLARAVKDGTMSKALAERLYNACRYLIICSTGDLPPNLQGIWSGTWTPEWSGDFTLDSNIQLEIQSMMSCNMPELMESYFNLIDSWLPDCRLNAKKLFGFRGALASLHASNHCLLLPRRGFPREQVAIGLAGWLLHFYYDYYQFTGDRKFLAQRFVPFAKEVALFYEDFLAGTEDANGKYRFYMGCSPEHELIANSTFDIAVAKNSLATLIAACKELGIESKNLPKWQAMLDKMPPYLINDAGELQEWSWPGVAEQPNHRHHSQFLPLYQFCEIDRDKTPALWKAAELAFELKVQNWLHRAKKSDSNHITHGMMNQGQCAARLGRSEIVHEVLSRMVTQQYVYPSFMISYWPKYKGFGMDPVGTIPDVVNNSLLFSWGGTIDLLLALPKEWPNGSVKGLRARGGYTVDIEWKDGKVTSYRIASPQPREVKVRVNGEIRKVQSEKL